MVRSDERASIAKKDNRYHLYRRLVAAVPAMRRNPVKAIALFAYSTISVLLWLNRNRILNSFNFGVFEAFLDDLYQVATAVTMIIGFISLLYGIGTPKGAISMKDAFVRIGFCNAAGGYPILLSRHPDKKNPRITVLEFDSCSIPLSDWEKQIDEIQTALNVVVINLFEGEDKRKIVLKTVPARGAIPDFVLWDDALLSSRNFELMLGEGLAGPVSLDLLTTPHVLIGGGTGSGKTVLLMNLLRQAHCKGAEIYLADAKYGVDFPGEKWKRICRMAFSDNAILEMLNELVSELETRRDILRASGYPNIDSYNEGAGQSYPRIIFACDEVAELLDKTGRTKEQKELTEKIIGKMETIARQGRACNINLILATQRPDAQTMPGHIKNNLAARICGKADQVLSQIVLDTTDAATMIPKDAQGRFLYGDVLFQAYWMEEKDW